MKRSIGPVTFSTVTAAAITTILVWVASMFGLAIPEVVQGAITTLIVFVAGYAVPPRAVAVDLVTRSDQTDLTMSELLETILGAQAGEQSANQDD